MKKQMIPGIRRDMFSVDPETLTLVDKAWLAANSLDESFHLYDPRAEREPEEALVLNIMAHGVQVPALVTKYGEQVLIVDGRQRWKAAMEANRRFTAEGKVPMTFPVLTKKGTESDLFGILVLTNELRYEDSTLVKAEKACKLLRLRPDDYAYAAVTFGVTERTIKNWEAMMTLTPAVKSAINAGKVPSTAALKLAKLTPTEQREQIAEIVSKAETNGKGKVTVREASTAASGKVDDRPSAKYEAGLLAWAKLPADVKAYLQWKRGEITKAEAVKAADWLREYESEVMDD